MKTTADGRFTMVGQRTRTALRSLGYEVKTIRPHVGAQPWFQPLCHGVANVMDGKGRNGELDDDAAWQACLDHLKANAETMCSRMMAAIMRTEGNDFRMGQQPPPQPPEREFWWASEDDTFYGRMPHDVVIALFLRICCNEEDA